MKTSQSGRRSLLLLISALACAAAGEGAETSGPVLNSKAALHGHLAAAATATGREQVAALLRYASAELTGGDPVSPSVWPPIVADQGIVKDKDGFSATTAEIERAISLEPDVASRKHAAAVAWPALAGAFAWLGDKTRADKYAALVPASADPEVIAKMRAQMGDVAGVDAALKNSTLGDREFILGNIAEEIWLGDPTMGEKLLQKLKYPNGDPQEFIAVHYAFVGEIRRATDIALKSDSTYYWKCIATAYEIKQDFAGAKTAKAEFLKIYRKRAEDAQKEDAYTAFQYQVELGKPEDAAATVKLLSKNALEQMAGMNRRWNVAAGEAACAAARLNDADSLKTILDAVAKMEVAKPLKDFVTEASNDGRAESLLSQGKVDDAIALAKTINSTIGWGSWKAPENLYRYAMEHGDIPLALRIEAAVGTTDMLHWVMRLLVKMQIEGTLLEGKSVDVFANIAARHSRFDRAEAARAVAEELIRRCAAK